MRRHQFVANTIAARMEVACVWQEEKSFQPLSYADTPEDEAVIARHFAARDASEEAYFADHETLAAPARRLAPGGCNSPEEIEAMRRLRPDAVLVFGTGLLTQPFIDAFDGNIINIHLGLSPYYRGAGTNFWPLVNGEPEFVGATIHYLDAGIDTGAMIAHARPEIDQADGPHDVGNKAIVAAARVLAAAAWAHVRGQARGVPQDGRGRLYQRKDFSAAAVRRLYQQFAQGMIAEYLANRAERDRPLSLLILPA